MKIHRTPGKVLKVPGTTRKPISWKTQEKFLNIDCKKNPGNSFNIPGKKVKKLKNPVKVLKIPGTILSWKIK